jgi:hypothetical protein
MSLTQAIERMRKNGNRIVNGKVAASAVIYSGALLAFNATGFVVNAADTVGFQFAGIAAGNADATGKADGEVTIAIDYDTTLYIPFATATQADVGKLVYAIAEDVIALSSVNITVMGKITYYDSDGSTAGSTKGVWVDTSQKA